MIYRITAQSVDNNITISAQTKHGVTQEEAIEMAKKDVFSLGPEHYYTFHVQQIKSYEEGGIEKWIN